MKGFLFRTLDLRNTNLNWSQDFRAVSPIHSGSVGWYWRHKKTTKIVYLRLLDMQKFALMAFLISLGFFLNPSDTYACGKSSEKAESPKTETCDSEYDSETKKCCANGHSEKDSEGCNGQCSDHACHCPSNSPIPLLLTNAQFSGGLKWSESIFYYQRTNYSSGFLSVWLPPKIGWFFSITATELSNWKQFPAFLIISFPH